MPAVIHRIISFITLVIGLALFFALVFVGILIYFNTPPKALEPKPALGPAGAESPSLMKPETEFDGLRFDGENAVYLEVRKGESARSVGRRLEQAGIIRSGLFWQLLCRFDQDFIKTGTYLLEIPASQLTIHRLLVSGKQLLRRVTIPEGVTLKKMAAVYEEAGICGAEDFLAAASDPAILAEFRVPGATMEGYLFPDTYLFPVGYPAVQAVRAMAEVFFKRLAETDPAAPNLNPAELNRAVIIASIVEREYRVADEAPLMAGVFYNRLRIGMALQSCATVEYVITEIQGKPHPEVLYTRDTEIQNPYNTYIRPGLPPGPISAPGTAALAAALRPVASEYLYFRLTDAAAGRHYFSKTLDDHIRAGALYVKGRQ